MEYFQGFVVPAKADHKKAYLEIAKKWAAICAEYGATRTVECWGDEVTDGKITDFKKAVRTNDDETVVFSWICWPDKATCDAGMRALMQDQRMRETTAAWNGPLAIFGGFTPILDTSHA
jgi:uncharacterized protein YbaA (DUF1428 family)